MKVLLVSSSPRKESNSDVLCDRFARGAAEAGHEIDRIMLRDKYSRDHYVLTNKLTNFFFKRQEDIRPFFESQLKACGVEYFDIYLMHAQGLIILHISRSAMPMRLLWN